MWSIGAVCVSEVVSLDHLFLYLPFAHDIWSMVSIAM